MCVTFQIRTGPVWNYSLSPRMREEACAHQWDECKLDMTFISLYKNIPLSFRYMLALALVGKLCSVLFFFLAWWFYRPPGGKTNAVVPSVDLVLSNEKTNGNGVSNGGANGYCNAALECSDHL